MTAMTLQGCAKCPEDGEPIKNGKVFFKKCVNDYCELDKVVCDEGYGFGISPEDKDIQMQFRVSKGDQCVIDFTKEPPYCHKCGEGEVTCSKVGEVMFAKFGDAASEDTQKSTGEAETKKEAG